MVIPFLKSNGKYVLFNNTLKNFCSEEYDFINPFCEGFAIAELEDEQFYIDRHGDVLKTQYKYYKIKDFNNGIAAVCRSESNWIGYRFINKNGIEIVDEEYNEYYQSHKDFIEVSLYKGFYYDRISNNSEPYKFSNGLLDLTGFEVIPPEEGISIHVVGKYLKVYSSNNEVQRFYDFKGNEVLNKNIEFFDYVTNFFQDRAVAILKDKNYVIIDDEFNIVKDMGKLGGLKSLGSSYMLSDRSTVNGFIAGLCAYSVEGKWGFFDINGAIVLHPKYYSILPFLDESAWKSKELGCTVVGQRFGDKIKYAVLNSYLQEITDFVFDEISSFNENLAAVRIKNKWGAINSVGEIIVPIEYPTVRNIRQGFIEVGLGDFDSGSFVGQFGFFNRHGKKVIPIIYQEVGFFRDGFCIIRRDEKYGLINSDGLLVFPCIYDKITYCHDLVYLVVKGTVKYYISADGEEFRE